jgi:hypothetical protein
MQANLIVCCGTRLSTGSRTTTTTLATDLSSCNAPQFCNELFTGLLGNGLYKKVLAATGLPLDLQWINTTAMVSYVSLTSHNLFL